jgi:hypothetical protein
MLAAVVYRLKPAGGAGSTSGDSAAANAGGSSRDTSGAQVAVLGSPTVGILICIMPFCLHVPWLFQCK